MTPDLLAHGVTAAALSGEAMAAAAVVLILDAEGAVAFTDRRRVTSARFHLVHLPASRERRAASRERRAAAWDAG